MVDLRACTGWYRQGEAAFLSDWREFLSFKSISADPGCLNDCRQCALWLSRHLQQIGFTSELVETMGKPLVLAHRPGQAGKPHILFYGHYDVQPIDPVDEWKSDPFTAEIRNGRMFARGAEDNKGQVMFVLKALQTLIAKQELHCPVTVLIEGEEETSSAGLQSILPKIEDRLKADVLMVCDTGAISPGVPCITMGLRGVIAMEIKLGGLTHDLHSGSFGGLVKNPATEMARLLSSFHAPDGTIAVDGYYDGVAVLDAESRSLMAQSPVSAASVAEVAGVPALGGEPGYSVAERKGVRPTIEVNGLHSGYGGPGGKTIIPAQAIAKITSRLVGKQDPHACMAKLEAHVKKHAPTGLLCEISEKGIGGGALLVNASSTALRRAREVLGTMSDGRIDYIWEGGSVPVVAALARHAGAEPLLVGFALPEDGAHAPNESFLLSQFEAGFTYACMMLSAW